MEESAQQAISLGVNVTIFVVALTASLMLMFGVRNLADISAEVDESVQDGSLMLDTRELDDRIIDGVELISYYYTYIKPYYVEGTEKTYNHPNVGVIIKDADDDVYKKYIQDGDISQPLQMQNESLDFNALFSQINRKAEYVVNVTEHYDNTEVVSGTTIITIEEIPVKNQSNIYDHYVFKIKPVFKNGVGAFFDNARIRVVVNGEYAGIVNVKDDNDDGDAKMQEIFNNNLVTGVNYSVRLKKVDVEQNMKTSNAILYIDKVQ